MLKKRFLEVCCSSPEDVLEAILGGASRAELCADLSIGGITPPEEWIRKALDMSLRLTGRNFNVNVLIRPRGGDFVFNEAEIEEMLSSIRLCKSLGVNAVVIGCLDAKGDVDMVAMRRLVAEARPMQVTFHRAFDVCHDPLNAFDDILALGCDRLLTSGQAADAYAGRELIAELVRRAGGRLRVMAGCGVRPSNIAAIEKATGVFEFHSSSHGPSGVTDRDVVAAMLNK